MNHSNKVGKPSAESEEGRPLIKENTLQPNTHSTPSEERVPQGLERVRKAAREHKEMKFTALLHHLTVDLLRESFYALKRKAAPGVGGVTWCEYQDGWKSDLSIFTAGYIAEPTELLPREEGTSRSLTGGYNQRKGNMNQLQAGTLQAKPRC